MAKTRGGAVHEQLLDRVLRDPETGDVVVAQWPNAPLLVYLGATAVRLVVSPDGRAGEVVSVVATAALAWWAVDEVLRGDSLFRRLLGAGVLTAMVVGRVAR